MARLALHRRLPALAGLALWLVPFDAPALTLDDCVRAALADHPSAQAAALRVEAAREAIGQARSAWYPLVSAEASLARTDQPPQAFSMVLNQRRLSFDSDFNQPEDTENLGLALQARFPLYTGGARRLTNLQAQRATDLAGLQREALLNELIYQVTRGYYGVLQAQALVDVQTDTVRSLEESLRVAQARYQAGSVVQTDVLNLEVRLAEAQENLIRARNAVALATASLNTAIGRDLAAAESLTPEPVRDVDPPPAETAEVNQRPELRAAESASSLQELAWKKTRAAYQPGLNLFGSMDWNSDVSSDLEESYFVGLAAQWDLFTGFRRGAAGKASRRQWEAAQADAEAVRNELRLDLRQAQLEATDAFERLAVSRKSVASAEEALRITQERYEGGAADVTELLTAQVGLTATRSRAVSAYYDYRIALSNIARARGELQARHGEAASPPLGD